MYWHVLFVNIFFVLSILIRNFWCRYLCPYGALLGVVSFFSVLKIHRNNEYLFHVRNLDMAFYQHNRGEVPAYNKETWLRMMKKIREGPGAMPKNHGDAKPTVKSILQLVKLHVGTA